MLRFTNPLRQYYQLIDTANHPAKFGSDSIQEETDAAPQSPWWIRLREVAPPGRAAVDTATLVEAALDRKALATRSFPQAGGENLTLGGAADFAPLWSPRQGSGALVFAFRISSESRPPLSMTAGPDQSPRPQHSHFSPRRAQQDRCPTPPKRNQQAQDPYSARNGTPSWPSSNPEALQSIQQPLARQPLARRIYLSKFLLRASLQAAFSSPHWRVPEKVRWALPRPPYPPLS